MHRKKFKNRYYIIHDIHPKYDIFVYSCIWMINGHHGWMLL